MAESKQPAPGDESEQLKRLHSRVEKLCHDLDQEVDSDLPGRDDLARICEVLKEIKGKIVTPTQDGGAAKELLPLSKREELENLLPSIERALAFQLQQRKQAPREQGVNKARLPSATGGCNPFSKPRSSSQQRRQEEDDEAVSLKLLLRLTQNVLEPEQYYEWTTSYVDESRIFGWDKEADELAEALVAPDGESSLLFRAAGIAGVHGSGKTALAQKVLVHDRAKDNFAIRLWVCVGPPDSEDRFGLLYRMLDNLGLDTAKVEDIVDNSNAVKQHREQALATIRGDKAKLDSIHEAAAKVQQEQTDKHQKAGDGDVKEHSIFNQLLKEAADESPDVQKSKIGVLLYILHMTLSKTSYMVVFDDIRAYDGDGGWYSNLALAPPPEGEWGDRLGYGLPKGAHRGAVLVTCRNEDHARFMVRSSGRVVRPPRLQLDDAWKLFTREYAQAKEAGKNQGARGDMLLKDLEQMKEQIVNKCLGLPVAIAEAAKGFAHLDPLPDDPPPPQAPEANYKPAADKSQDDD